MKTPLSLRTGGRAVLCAAALATGTSPSGLAQQQPVLSISPLPDRHLQVNVSGEAPQFHRLDASTNLMTWLPVVLLTNATGVATYEGTNAPDAPMRFFRAEQVPAAVGVAALGQPNGPAGGQLEIFGQFFDGNPGDNVVRIGGVEARVIEASPTRLLVEIPTNATTSPLTVTTPSGETTVRELFVVMGTAAGTFQPPPGVEAAQFRLANPYGDASPRAPGNPTNFFIVRRGRPLLNVAAPTNELDKTLFLAVTLTDGGAFVIDVASTAQALVFMHPLVQTREPEASAAVLAIIAADAQVQALASNIAALYPLGGDPFTNEVFLAAYTNAVVSVAGGAAGQALGAARLRAAAIPQANNVDLEYILLTHNRGDLFVKGRPLNSVDWGLTLSRIDVGKAFPGGEADLRRAMEFDERLTVYPGTDVQRFDIRSDPAFARFKVIEAAIKALSEAVVPPTGERLELGAGNGVYLLRAIGPGVADEEEIDFTNTKFPNESTRVIAINLLNAVVDLLDLTLDESTTAALGGPVGADLVKAALREAGHIQSASDFADAVAVLLKDAVFAIAKQQTEKAVKDSLTELVGKTAGAVAAQVLGFLKLISVPGRLGERLYGLYSSTAMETAFIVTGNPFQLEVMSVTPPSAAVGENLEIMIRGAHFSTSEGSKDLVGFTTYRWPGKIVSVASVGTDGERITVQVPTFLTTNAPGAIPLHIIAQGRRADTNFTLVRAPQVTDLAPTVGFAAVADYLGAPFEGTAVRLRGTGFGPANEFLFGTALATNVSGSEGDVIVRVPAGAETSVVTVRSVDTNGVPHLGYSPEFFNVLDAPQILTNSPAAGHPGSGLRVSASNLGPGPVAVLFRGAPLGPLNRAGLQLATVIPFDAPTGPAEVRVATPAGLSAPVTVNVLEGPGPGGIVQVGGPFDDKSPPATSLITLARAALFAGTTNALQGAPPDCSGGEFCVDDQDVVLDPSGVVLAQLDPPDGPAYEEGDFMTDNGTNGPPRFPIGAAYVDSVAIAGTVVGDVTFTGNQDTIFGVAGPPAVVEGPFILVGNQCHLHSLILHGTLTILGDGNDVNVTVTGADGPGVVVRGHHNSINVTTTSNSGDGLIVEGGSFNTITVSAMRNTGNGVTVRGGANGNSLSVWTAFPGVPPGSGNTGHGVAISDASHTVVLGFGLPIGGNGGCGVLVDPGATDTELHSVTVESNALHGIHVGPGVTNTTMEPVMARRNGQHGIFLEGCSATTLRSAMTGFNGGSGIVVASVEDSTTSVEFSSLSNAVSALCLTNGTRRIRCTGMSTGDGAGVQLAGTNISNNNITLRIDGGASDGAQLLGGAFNELTLAVGNCGGHGLFVSGGLDNTVSLTASNNALDGAHFADGARANTLTGVVVSNRTGVVLAGGAHDNRVQGLRANANREHGLRITGAGTSNNRVLNALIGVPDAGLPPVEPGGNALDGIRIDSGASDNTLGADSGHGPEVRNNGAAGIRIAGGSNNVILGARVTLAERAQPAGIIVEDGATDTILGGFTEAERCTNSLNGVGIYVRGDARRTVVQNCLVEANGGAGLLIEDAPDTLVGGTRAGVTNEFLNNFSSGVELSGTGTTGCRLSGNYFSGNETGVTFRDGAAANRLESDNAIFSNTTGLRLDDAHRTVIYGNTIQFNETAVECRGGATDNFIVGNDIEYNLAGVVVNGAATRRILIVDNVITANLHKGIELQDGANDGIEAPQITAITSQSVMGTNNAPEGSAIAVYSDPQDEGRTALGSGSVHRGRFAVMLKEPLKIPDVGFSFNLHATVTDLEGNTSEFGDYLPAGNADGGVQIAFASTRDGNSEIYLTDGSSDPPTRLTSDPADDHSPAFSPDGGSLTFVSTRTGNPELFLMTLSNTTALLQLTTNSAPDYDPAWSPGGSNLVFVSERDGDAEIYRMTPDGSDVTRLTFDVGIDRWPSVSPDGAKIVFVSTRNGNFELFIMNADGTGVAPLTSGPGDNTRPVWSPDGGLIAFVSDRDGNAEIYTVKPDGSELTRLTFADATDIKPSWAPNGQTLVFASNRDEGFELYFAPRTGGPAVRLTVSTGDNTHPSVAKR